MDEDRLVSSPPMDIIVQKRQAALKDVAEQRRREKELKPDKVKDDYNWLLKGFASAYFKGRTRYDELSPQEQKALAKICFRHSLRKSILTFLPLSTGIASLILLGKDAGQMIVWGLLGLALSTLILCLLEGVINLMDSFHIYEGLLFIKKHFYLKRKKLL